MQQIYAQSYAQLYATHWWWRARESVLINVLRSIPLQRPAEILDFGCGDGLLFPVLTQFGEVRGIETDSSVLTADGPYRSKIKSDPLDSSTYEDWQFDLIIACDVLEHIDDDFQAAQNLLRMLKPGGFLLITVPAAPVLWDLHDQINHHYRRYTKNRLATLFEGKCQCLQLRYLFHSLFFAKLAFKALNLSRHNKIPQHSMPPAWISKLAERFLRLEYVLLQPLNVPFGTSLLFVGRV